MSTKLTPAARTLTGGRSFIPKAETKVETPKSWALCLITISQYLKMRWAILNTHTDGSVNLCARSCIRVASKKGWNGISGPSARRCWSCWHWPYRTQRWILGLEKFLINPLHSADTKVKERKTLDYISVVANAEIPYLEWNCANRDNCNLIT